MHLVVLKSNGSFGALPSFYTWLIIVGAAYGALRLVVDTFRFFTRRAFVQRAVDRERTKKARTAQRAPLVAEPADAGAPAEPFAWWKPHH